MNIFYEGTLTGTSTNGIMDVIISRVAEHSCRCDECLELDRFDLPILALCKRYIQHEIDISALQIEKAKILWSGDPNERGPRLDKYFSRGSSDLETAISFLELESQIIPEGVGPFREEEFRLKLEGLIYGYEIRMRTVHFWTKGPQ